MEISFYLYVSFWKLVLYTELLNTSYYGILNQDYVSFSTSQNEILQ